MKKFLKEFSRLKDQIKELTGQNSLLTKDKAFLTGRNEYLEKSNQDLTKRLTAVSEQASNLQRSNEDLLQKSREIRSVLRCVFPLQVNCLGHFKIATAFILFFVQRLLSVCCFLVKRIASIICSPSKKCLRKWTRKRWRISMRLWGGRLKPWRRKFRK